MNNSFHNSIGLELGHAPANIALHRILSEKLQFLRFSQVPTGSDYPLSDLYCRKPAMIVFRSSFLFYIVEKLFVMKVQ